MKSFKVRAKRGVLVPVPRLHERNMHGQIAEYVGREVNHTAFASKAPRFDGMRNHDAPTEADIDVLYPVSSDPTEVTVAAFGVHGYHDLLRAARDGDLELVHEPKATPAAAPSEE